MATSQDRNAARVAQLADAADGAEHRLLHHVIDVRVAVHGPADDVVDQREVGRGQGVKRAAVPALRGDHGWRVLGSASQAEFASRLGDTTGAGITENPGWFSVIRPASAPSPERKPDKHREDAGDNRRHNEAGKPGRGRRRPGRARAFAATAALAAVALHSGLRGAWAAARLAAGAPARRRPGTGATPPRERRVGPTAATGGAAATHGATPGLTAVRDRRDSAAVAASRRSVRARARRPRPCRPRRRRLPSAPAASAPPPSGAAGAWTAPGDVRQPDEPDDLGRGRAQREPRRLPPPAGCCPPGTASRSARRTT